MLRTAILSAVLILGSQTLAFAQDKCANPDDQQTTTECADLSFNKSDKQLNDIYKQIEGRLSDDADTRKLLGQAQRAWIKFRDAECDFKSSASAGGTARPMIVAICEDGITQSRIKDLQAYLKCEEGALDCPVPVGK